MEHKSICSCGEGLSESDQFCANCGSRNEPGVPKQDVTQQTLHDQTWMSGYAGFFERVAAFSIDAILVALPFRLIETALSHLLPVSYLAYVVRITSFFFLFTELILLIYFEAFHMATPGKMIMGIKISTSNLKKPNILMIFKRNLVKKGLTVITFFFSSIMALAWLIGFTLGSSMLGFLLIAAASNVYLLEYLLYTMCTLTTHRQTLHDMVSGTYVIRTDRKREEWASFCAALLGFVSFVMLVVMSSYRAYCSIKHLNFW